MANVKVQVDFARVKRSGQSLMLQVYGKYINYLFFSVDHSI